MVRASLVVLYIVSVLLAGIAGWRMHQVYTGTPRPAAASRPVPPDRLSGELQALRDENAALKQLVDQSRRDREDAENEHLRLVLQQSLRQMAEDGVPQSRPADLAWERGFAAHRRHRDRGMFGGLDSYFNLMLDMASKGAAGIATLERVINDAGRDMAERKAALDVLARIRDKRALAAILELRVPEIMELDYPYDLIAPQVSALPTGDIREFSPAIIEHIGRDLGTDDLAPEKVDVLALLALMHREPRAQQLMNDPRILKEDAGGAIQVADQVHSEQARQFVQWLAENHTRQAVAQLAAETLQQW